MSPEACGHLRGLVELDRQGSAQWGEASRQQAWQVDWGQNRRI